MPWSVRYVEQTTSTNDDILRIARAGGPEGAVLTAGHQTEGRGRQGRQWMDRPGHDLIFSILLRPQFPAGEYPLLSLLVATATVEALNELTRGCFGAKWPNDIVFGGRKVGGILLVADSAARYAVIGIGINFYGGAESLPDALKQTTTTVSEAAQQDISRSECLAATLSNIWRAYRAVHDGQWQRVLETYRRIDVLVGNQVELVRADETIVGLAEAIDGQGRLVIAGPHGRFAADGGDVHLVK